MSDPTADWFYLETVDEERRADLSRFGSFESLVASVVEDADVIRAISYAGQDDGLRGSQQPWFFLDLPKTGDALFNGPHGYRAQYWRSPWQGLEANAYLIASLLPKLLAAIDISTDPKLAEIDVTASLKAVSAKVWIREARSTVGANRDLLVEPWRSSAAQGVELAKLGLAAPRCSKYEVKGALLDSFGNERVPASKVRRHHDIHRYGFS